MDPEWATSVAWCVRQLGWEDGELEGVLEATDAFYGAELDDESELVKGVAKIREKAVNVSLGQIVFDTVLTEQGAEGLSQIGVMERSDLNPMIPDVRRREYVINFKNFISQIEADDYLDHYVKKYFKAEELEKWKTVYRNQLIPFLVTIFEKIDPGAYARFDSLTGRKDVLGKVIKFMEQVFAERRLSGRNQAVYLLVRKFVEELLEGVMLDIKDFTMQEILGENLFLKEDLEDREGGEEGEEYQEYEEGEDDPSTSSGPDGEEEEEDWGMDELEGWKD